MSNQKAWTLPLITHLLLDLRQVVSEMLQSFPKDVRDAASMVAAELASNATKYGMSVPAAPEATITLAVTPLQIQIAVRNGVISADGVLKLQDQLRQIASVDSKEPLYMNRLQQMLEDPTQTGQLGLYRIGFEGQFELTCTYVDQVLTVIATRGIR